MPGGIGLPVWVDDRSFDLAYHVRHTALPAPASRADLDTVIGRLMSAGARPAVARCGRSWMIDGLPDGPLGARVQGPPLHGRRRLRRRPDDHPAGRPAPTHAPPAPDDDWVPAHEPSDAMLVAESLGQTVRQPTIAARDPVRPFAEHRARAAAADPRGVRRRCGRSVTASCRRRRSSIQGAIGPHRRWSAAHADLADIKTIKQAFGGTVNDVVLAVIAGAFRDLLTDLGEDPDHAVLRALVPVSVRPAGDGAPNNQVSAMIAELPSAIADPLERLESDERPDDTTQGIRAGRRHPAAHGVRRPDSAVAAGAGAAGIGGDRKPRPAARRSAR